MQAPISYEALVRRIRDIQLMLGIAKGEWRAWSFDTELGLRLTVGRSWDRKDWGTWLGFFSPERDSEAHGHGYPFWTATGVYRGTHAPTLAQNILAELERQVELSRGWTEVV